MSNKLAQIEIVLNILKQDDMLGLSKLESHVKKSFVHLISLSLTEKDYAGAINHAHDLHFVNEERYKDDRLKNTLCSELLASLNINLNHLYIEQLDEKLINTVDMINSSFKNGDVELHEAVIKAINGYDVYTQPFKDLYNQIKLKSKIDPFKNSALISHLMLDYITIKQKLISSKYRITEIER